jgi:hypothetical protein
MKLSVVYYASGPKLVDSETKEEVEGVENLNLIYRDGKVEVIIVMTPTEAPPELISTLEERALT